VAGAGFAGDGPSGGLADDRDAAARAPSGLCRATEPDAEVRLRDQGRWFWCDLRSAYGRMNAAGERFAARTGRRTHRGRP